MFSNTNSADCGDFTQCYPMPVGCTGTYAGNVNIDGTQALQIKQNVDAGYKETLCIMCRNLAGSTIQHDSFVIEQVRNCATALTGALQTVVHPAVSIEYRDGDTTLHVAAANSAVFFTNPHNFKADGTTTLCGLINNCVLKQAGCVNAYTLGNAVIDATTGEVKLKKNVDAGYEDILCVECKNTANSVV
jgi:hypothetical protein